MSHFLCPLIYTNINELEQKKEYYILVRDLTRSECYKGYYGMPDGGYDVFEEINGEYVNVLTQKTLIIP